MFPNGCPDGQLDSFGIMHILLLFAKRNMGAACLRRYRSRTVVHHSLRMHMSGTAWTFGRSSLVGVYFSGRKC